MLADKGIHPFNEQTRWLPMYIQTREFFLSRLAAVQIVEHCKRGINKTAKCSLDSLRVYARVKGREFERRQNITRDIKMRI